MKPNPNSMLPPEARDWLERALAGRSGFVIELGSGHGSRLLQQAIAPASLISVEHDERFMEFADVHAPIRDGWYDRDAIEPHLPSNILAVVVDGPPAKIGRLGLLDNLDLFPHGSIYVIDDVHRDTDRKLAIALAGTLDRDVTFHDCGRRAFATIGGDL